jgi:hypothetical protein
MTEFNSLFLVIAFFNEIYQMPSECGNKRRREKGNIMEGVNFFKIYCNHVWNYHNEISLIINV